MSLNSNLNDNKTKVNQERDEAPVYQLISRILTKATFLNASDVHIEPKGNSMSIRYRVDGFLQEHDDESDIPLQAIVLRLKLMANLNISERRLPQEGRFSLLIQNKKLDIRLASMPQVDGESIVLRLFDQSSHVKRLFDLGMPPNILEKVLSVLSQHGMILVTGPTGAGKSTTLYATLNEMNSVEKKIITIEDPVEYTFKKINQIQVDPKIGLTFSNILRSTLRLDPDVIMVGEIRDEETASMALRSAMTGHLLLSTMHTNNALSAPSRLLEMGIPGFLIASALRLVIAQRLVRKICVHCQEPYKPTAQESILLDTLMRARTEGIQFLEGKGCDACQGTGYQGRLGVYEMLEMNQGMMEALREGSMKAYMSEAHKSDTYRSLTHWGLDYACQGLTSIKEIFRLLQDMDEGA